MKPDMRCDHGMQWTVKRYFPFLLWHLKTKQLCSSIQMSSHLLTSALALITGKPYKYAWCDLLSDSKLGAGINFVVIHSYTWENSVILEVFPNQNNSLILRQSATVQICIGRERFFFHVSALAMGTKFCFSQLQSREGKMLWKFGNSRFSPSRGVQGVRRWDHAGFDTRLFYFWPVEHLLSVLHSFKAK